MSILNRIQETNLDDFIKSKFASGNLKNNELNEQGLLFGVVISNDDPLNINRIKVRIPRLDDKIYEGVDNIEQGNANLPWCLPISRNFIGTPETGSIVLIELLNVKTPNFGRVYIDCLTDLNDIGIFDYERLIPEYKTYLNWENAEKAININIVKNSPEIEVEENKVKYEVGIRGKGVNKILLNKDSIELTQNKEQEESYIKMNKDIDMDSSNEIFITSKKGATEYHPVFHKPLYDYINETNELLKNIITIMNTTPSLSGGSGIPNLPAPTAPQLISKLSKLYASFSKLKIDGNGHSKFIWIN